MSVNGIHTGVNVKRSNNMYSIAKSFLQCVMHPSCTTVKFHNRDRVTFGHIQAIAQQHQVTSGERKLEELG